VSEKTFPGEILDRQPPFDLDAEMAVLGSVMLKPNLIDELAGVVSSDDFYDDADRRLFACMQQMHGDGEKIDITLLVDRLKTTGDFEAIGGAAYLHRIGGSVANAAHARYYAKIVRKHCGLRRLIDAGSEIVREAYDASTDLESQIAAAEQRVFAIRDRGHACEAVSSSHAATEFLDYLDGLLRGEPTSAIGTHFADLDAILAGGFRPGEVIVLAGRPGMGKTTFGIGVSVNVGVHGGGSVLFVSLEMSRAEVEAKIACTLTGVNGHRLREGSVSTEDRQSIIKAMGEFTASDFFICDRPAMRMGDIASLARRVTRRSPDGRLSLIVIDYLQLIEPDDNRPSRVEQVSQMTRRVKTLAREQDCPVLLLSQLNRQTEAAKDNRPRLFHLRESGSIEQDADVVTFVHRPAYYMTGDEAKERAAEAVCIVAKQRNGYIGDVPLHWEASAPRFMRVAEDWRDEMEGGF